MYGKLQSHTNIVESRKQAAAYVSGSRGKAIYLVGERYSKAFVVKMIQRGALDGYYYYTDGIMQDGTIRPVIRFAISIDFVHSNMIKKIGR